MHLGQQRPPQEVEGLGGGGLGEGVLQKRCALRVEALADGAKHRAQLRACRAAREISQSIETINE